MTSCLYWKLCIFISLIHTTVIKTYCRALPLSESRKDIRVSPHPSPPVINVVFAREGGITRIDLFSTDERSWNSHWGECLLYKTGVVDYFSIKKKYKWIFKKVQFANLPSLRVRNAKPISRQVTDKFSKSIFFMCEYGLRRGIETHYRVICSLVWMPEGNVNVNVSNQIFVNTEFFEIFFLRRFLASFWCTARRRSHQFNGRVAFLIMQYGEPTIPEGRSTYTMAFLTGYVLCLIPVMLCGCDVEAGVVCPYCPPIASYVCRLTFNLGRRLCNKHGSNDIYS